MNLENKVIYQVYPKSFKDSNNDGIGDIQGIIEKLPYLSELGIDYLWLSPINQSPQKDNGYDISNYMEIDPIFGTKDDYIQLIKEASQYDIKIMMDLVLNHTSTEHEWFKKAIAGDPYYQDFYYFKDKPTNMDSIFGGSAWNYVPELNQYYFCFFDKTQADLNFDNVNVRNEQYKMINYWIELGVGGFRLDVIDHISKDLDNNQNSRGPHYVEYLKELNQATFKDQLLTVGECWGASVEQMNEMCNAEGLFQAFHFEDVIQTNDGPKWNQKPFNLKLLANTLEKWQNKYKSCNAIVMNNHDLPRLMSLWLNDDTYRYESATLLITVYSLLKGNLYIYQGEEIGMTNANFDHIDAYRDVESINAYHQMMSDGLTSDEALSQIMKVSRDNARVPMSWDQSKYAGFSNHQPWISNHPKYLEINVKEDLSSKQSIYRYYQKMITFRKNHYELLKEETKIYTQNSLLIIERKNITLVANFSEKTIEYPFIKEVCISNTEVELNRLKPYQVIVY